LGSFLQASSIVEAANTESAKILVGFICLKMNDLEMEDLEGL